MFRNPLTDAIVVLVIVLLVMGPKRLPGLGKGLGQGMREFKEGITGDSKGGEKLSRKPVSDAAATSAAPGREAGSEPRG